MRRMAVTALLAVLAVAAGGLLGCGLREDINAGTTGNIDMAKDEATKAGILAIQTGIVGSISAGEAAPAVVDASTLGDFVDPWPKNPWTNQPMRPGAGKGDFTYENLGGVSYRLTGHLSDGEYAKP